GINSAKTELNSLNEKLKETESINKNLDGSFLALGVTATVVFAGIVSSVNKGIEAYTQYTNAISGLRSQMEYVGEDMGRATEMIKELTADGLISESDVAMSIKNLTLYGYSLEEANQIILRLKDSAAYNRQAHYDLGEAVRVTTEGIRNENSVLSDAAGVTKNIAKMYEEYAKSLGKSTDSLTQAEKQQAVLNGILVETEAMVGNAISYSEQLGGVMAKEEAQVKRLAQAYGSALEPSIKELKSHLNSLIGGFTNFINENQELVVGATASTTSLVLMGTALIGLKKGVPIIKNLINGFKQGTVAIKGFNVSLGAVGLALTGISVAIGVFTSIKTSIEKAKEEQKALNEEVEKFNTLMLEATTEKNINLKTTELDNLKQAKKDLEEIANYFENDHSVDLNTGLSLDKENFKNIFIKELGKTEEDLNNFKASLKKCGVDFNDLFTTFNEFIPSLNVFDEKIKELTVDVDGFSESLEFNVSLDGISNTLNSLNSLSSACDKLVAGEKLTNEELSKLIAQYPIIAEYIANTGDLTLNKGEIARQVVEEEIEAQKRAMETEQQRIDKAITETKKLIETKKQLNETQTGDMFDKIAQEIANLEERLKEYEEQSLSAKASITILNDEMAKMGNEKMLSGLKGMQTEVANLEKAYETLANSEQLSYEQVKQLIDIYPELQQYITKTGDVTFNSGKVILQVIGNVKQAYNEKRASLIENSKAEIKAIQEKINAITNAYEQERQSIIKLIKARQSLVESSGAVVSLAVGDAAFKVNSAILEKEKAKLENSIKEIESIGNIANNASKKAGSISSNNKSNASSIKEQKTELEKQLEIYNKLNETTEMSAKQQLEHLESLKNVYAKTPEDFDKINKLIYSARKQANDDWYNEEIKSIQKLNKGREDNTDFQGIINEYKNLIEEIKIAYKDYPETLKKLTDDLDNYIIEATNNRNQKLYNIET
ncbi:MAG: hypothetical protein K2F59_03240, partial [Eubacteriales bacterium]|nr:hypothetical protein [Eubacteriales bacterium]